MNNNVLITGGSGLLAVNWALAMRSRANILLGIHHRRIHLTGVDTLTLNIETENGVLQALDAVQPDMVVHAAGLTSVELCEQDPALASSLNVQLAENVARACRLRGISMVHISTDHLFKGEKPSVHENEKVCPLNEYGRTKSEAEVRVLELNPGALVVRTNFYGWGPTYRRSFSDFIIDSLRAGREISLFEDVFYTPLLVESVSEVVHCLVDATASGVYHVVGDERVSKYEFGLRIADQFDLNPSLIRSARISDRDDLVQRPHDMSLSNAKACAVMGRSLGGVDEQLACLNRQEQNGWAQELNAL